jgi:hypothetical protein
MYDWLMSLGESIIPVIAILGGFLVAAIGIVASTWRKHRQTEMEIALKHEMLNRGMSAEEIERVIKASKTS